MIGGGIAREEAIPWIALRPLIASMAILALNSGLWVRRLCNSIGEGFACSRFPNSETEPRLLG